MMRIHTTLLALSVVLLCTGYANSQLVATAGNFPFTRCFSAPGGNPYTLTGPGPVVVDNQLWVNLTFVANPVGNPQDFRGCFRSIEDTLFKIAFNSRRECVGKIRVFINGERRGNNIFWEQYINQPLAGVLRITRLNLTDGGALGTTISLLGQEPCNTVNTFGAPNGGPLRFYMTNTSNHRCCPLGSWNWGLDAPQTPTILPPPPPGTPPPAIPDILPPPPPQTPSPPPPTTPSSPAPPNLPPPEFPTVEESSFGEPPAPEESSDAAPTPSPVPEESSDAAPTPTPVPEESSDAAPTPTPTPEESSDAAPTPTPVPEESSDAAPTPTPTPTPEESSSDAAPTPVPGPTPTPEESSDAAPAPVPTPEESSSDAGPTPAPVEESSSSVEESSSETSTVSRRLLRA